MLNFLGNIASSLFNNFLNDESADDQRDAQAAINERNYQAQKEFAQNGLQWKAADAAAAGLHPMAALGSSGAAFSPSYQVSPGAAPMNLDLGGLFDDMDSMGEHGQNTARAQRAVLSDHDRQMQAAVLRNQELQNALLEGQNTQLWASIMGQPSNPPGPGPVATRPDSPSGQVQTFPVRNNTGIVPSGIVKLEPSKSESTRPGDRGLAAGRSPMFRDQVVSNKTTIPMLSQEMGEIMEGYGEFNKLWMPWALHAKRWWDNRPTRFVQKRSPKPFFDYAQPRYIHRKPLGGK